MPRLHRIDVKEGLSPEKAWLLGFLAGDGSFEHVPCRIYRVTAHCGDEELVPRIMEVFHSSYDGVKCSHCVGPVLGHRTKEYHYVRCYQKTVVENLLSLAPFGLFRWRVPQTVKEGSQEVQAAWLRGYFDADGTVIFDAIQHTRYVEVPSVNRAGLDDVAGLLEKLWIRFSRHERSPAPPDSRRYEIRISYHEDLQRFRDLVGFASQRKQKILDGAIESRERFPVRKSIVEGLVPEIGQLRHQGKTFREIGEEVGLLKVTVQAVCERHGFVPASYAEGGGRVNRKRGARAALYPEIARLREQGTQGTEIARRLGLKDRREVNDIVKYEKRRNSATSSK